MRKVLTALLLLLPFGFLSAHSTTTAPPRAIVIDRVTLIDVAGAPPRADMTVVVSGNRIAAVGKRGRVPIPAGALVVDGAGKFLIPGLWDMHIHALHKPRVETFLPLLVANGVTGIRDMATHTPLEEVSRWKQEIASGARVGPHIVAAGLILDGPKPLNPTVSIAVKGEDDGREAVRLMKKQGADFIKVYSSLSRDAFHAIADEAKQQGLSIAGHLPTSVTACEASAAGQRSFEHMLGWFESCSNKAARVGDRGKAVASEGGRPGPVAGVLKQIVDAKRLDDAAANALAKTFSKHDTWLTPTISARWALTSYDQKLASHGARLRYISPSMQESWRKNLVFSQFTAEDLEKLRRGFDTKLKAIQRLHRGGARFLAGTDTGVPDVFPGFSLHDELALFVRAGMTPLEALQTATINPAKFLGREKELGSIEAGKVADLILLDASPLADITNTTKISAVVANGRFFDRESLDSMLAGAEAAARE